MAHLFKRQQHLINFPSKIPDHLLHMSAYEGRKKKQSFIAQTSADAFTKGGNSKLIAKNGKIGVKASKPNKLNPRKKPI